MSDWTSPGVEAVAPGVHRIPLPLPNDGLRAVNVYAVLDGDGVTLVDAGWALADSLDLLEAGLRELEVGLRDVRRILVTHGHQDHYTQAVTIRERVGTPVLLGEHERTMLETILDPDDHMGERRSAAMRRMGAAELAERIQGARNQRNPYELPDSWLADEQRVELDGRTLQVTHTPGHTRGHVVFADDAAGLLFAGDHVLPRITPSIAVEPDPPELALGDYLGSLARVRAMPDRRLLPAHGPVTDSVHARIDELLAHHDTRLAHTLAAVEQGTTCFAVAGRLAWTRHERAFADLDLFNQLLAVGETRAHLDLLVSQGRLTRTTTDGVEHYGS
ncbi:MBL fold metallo-hydrolase [Rhodococcus aerolatus]